jgi:putative transposase
MTYHPQKHQRQSIRLRQYDYSWPGAYFVTLCVREKDCVLGEIVDGEMRLSEWGRIVHEFWDVIPDHFPNVSVDGRITMPNHGHAIIKIDHARRGAVAAPHVATPNVVASHDAMSDDAASHDGNAGGKTGEETSPLRPTLGQIVAYYKYQTTKRINELRGRPGVPFWQRNYWEHVVRDEIDLNRIRQYIENNPLRWHEDQLNPIAPPRPTKR